MGKIKNLAGQKFGMLTVIEDTGIRNRRNVVWSCLCDCGNYKNVDGVELTRGNVSSCGCKKETDITGQKFGRLLAIRKHHKSDNNKWFWECKCDCGNNAIVPEGALKFGKIKSCGCLAKEKFIERTTKHGMSNTRLYKIWSGMKSRCNNPRNYQYKNYGGRGIKVCTEWLSEEGFVNFYNWAMNNGYDENLTLDREEVNGNYEPNNCRWVDNFTQQNNRRDCVYIEVLGEKHTIAEWSKKLNIPTTTISNRLNEGFKGVDIFKSHIPKYANENRIFIYIAGKKIYLNNIVSFLDDELNQVTAKFIGINNSKLMFQTENKELEYNNKSIIHIYKQTEEGGT